MLKCNIICLKNRKNILASDGKLEEISNLLERQNANLEQFKQQIRQLKMSIHSVKARQTGRLSYATNSLRPTPSLLNRERDYAQSESSV